MNSPMRGVVFVLAAVTVCAWAGSPLPLTHAHAHNDYLHAHPLLDALEQGFCSVEADIFLVEGQLLVAHDLEKAQPGQTLTRLYLEPLANRARTNGGHVFKTEALFTLLIDIKSEAESTYAALCQELERWKDILTVYRDGKISTNAVTIILSGNRPIATVAAEQHRWVAIDGRLSDLETNAPASVIPLISDNWTKHFEWRGEGELSGMERRKLKEIVSRTHEQGRRLRFWATPDNPRGWAELRACGVDLINTDDLTGLAAFLGKSPAQ